MKPGDINLIYKEFQGRLLGLVKALTVDQEKLLKYCDPDKDALCLYGKPDGNWSVDYPVDLIPSDLPEPVIGINYVRDSMDRFQWVMMVAQHSEGWLIGSTFHCAIRLNKEDRLKLFNMMNSNTSVFDRVLSFQMVTHNQKFTQSQKKEIMSSIQNPKVQHTEQLSKKYYQSNQKKKRKQESEDEDDNDNEIENEYQNNPFATFNPYNNSSILYNSSNNNNNQQYINYDYDNNNNIPNNEMQMQPPQGDEKYDDGDGDPCPTCGRPYVLQEFWIACDFCNLWYCGKCAKMTEAKAAKIPDWKCQNCISKLPQLV